MSAWGWEKCLPKRKKKTHRTRIVVPSFGTINTAHKHKTTRNRIQIWKYMWCKEAKTSFILSCLPWSRGENSTLGTYTNCDGWLAVVERNVRARANTVECFLCWTTASRYLSKIMLLVRIWACSGLIGGWGFYSERKWNPKGGDRRFRWVPKKLGTTENIRWLPWGRQTNGVNKTSIKIRRDYWHHYMYRLLCLLASINLPLILILKTLCLVPFPPKQDDVVNATVFFLCFFPVSSDLLYLRTGIKLWVGIEMRVPVVFLAYTDH